jgi:hypothetical protein
MEQVRSEHYNIHRKRAAVDVYRAALRYRREVSPLSVTPMSIARVASGGAAASQIYRWLSQNLSDEAHEARMRRHRQEPMLTEDQEKLLVGFAVSQRSRLEPLSLQMLQHFCETHLERKPSLATTISKIMNRNGMTSQRVLARSSRMTSADVVNEAVDFLEEIRSYEYPPHRIICMDETGLWSNVTRPKTYHFQNWSVIVILLKCPAKPLNCHLGRSIAHVIFHTLSSSRS